MNIKPYRKRKLTSYQVTVLQGLVAGMSEKDIYQKFGISISTIRNAKESLKRYGYYEEKEEENRGNKKLTLIQEMVLVKIGEGKTRKQIAEECEVTYCTVQNAIKVLIARGLISKEEVKNSKRDGNSISLLKIEVLRIAKTGNKTRKQIAEEVNANYNTVIKILRDLIIEGMISEQNIKPDKSQKTKVDKFEGMILDDLKKGKTKKQIQSKYNISSYVFKNIMKNLLSKGLISESELKISELTDIQKKVLDGVKQGKTRSQIVEEYKINYSSITTAIKFLLKNGFIKQEDIVLKRCKTFSIQEQMLKGAKQEGTNRQVDKNLNLDYTEVNSDDSSLIKREMIPKTEVRTPKDENQNELTKIQQSILEDVKAQMTITEIAEKHNLKYAKVYSVIQVLIKKGLISESEIKKQERQKVMGIELSALQMKIIEGIESGKSLPEIAEECEDKHIGRTVLYLIRKGLIDPNKVKTEVKSKDTTKNKKRPEEHDDKEDLDKEKKEATKKSVDSDEIVDYEELPDKIKELRKHLNTGEKPDARLIQEAKNEIDFSKKRADEYLVNIMLRGYSKSGNYRGALGFINECRKKQRDLGDFNQSLEEKFREIEGIIQKGIREKNAVRNMKFGASIRDAANDAGIRESTATALYKKYVAPDNAPDYEIEF